MRAEPQVVVSPAVLRCPACDGAESSPVGQVATAFESVVGGRTFLQPAYSIRCCAACDLYFKSHAMALEHFGAYYAQLESATFETDWNYPTDRLLHQALERLTDGSKVVDFGCSTGRILKTFTRRLDCFGVEPNAQAAVSARGRGIRIIAEEELRDGQHGDFDAILLADVYEHLPRPVALVEMLVSRLKPGGWLALVTGNADAIHTREFIGEYWYFRTPGHLLMLSAKHLTWLANRLGLTVQALHRCSHYNTSLSGRSRQWAQSLAYYQFRQSPQGVATALLRLVPGIRRAERWPTAPALTCTSDHVVAILQKPSS